MIATPKYVYTMWVGGYIITFTVLIGMEQGDIISPMFFVLTWINVGVFLSISKIGTRIGDIMLN